MIRGRLAKNYDHLAKMNCLDWVMNREYAGDKMRGGDDYGSRAATNTSATRCDLVGAEFSNAYGAQFG